ncbi:MAG: biopolymer transporter ExbD [Vicingaceae bacterium]
MARRELPEINAGSMADIAFLLLIFFLVTTTMDTDGGLTRKLPPMPEEQLEDLPEVKQRNVFEVLVNANDQLLVEGQLMLVSELREAAKEFIVSNPSREDLPEFKLTDVQFFGEQYPVSKQIISLQNDRGTSYEMYIKVQNELVAAYNELRDELAMNKFGKLYNDLEEDQGDAVQDIYPQRISEAEPKSIGE